jgi:hypothetical protein
LIRQIAYDPAGPAGESGARALRGYLLARGPDGREADPLVQLLRAQDIITAWPTSGLGWYLVGRLLAQRNQHPEAVSALERAASLGFPDVVRELVARENDRLLARASFLAGDLTTTRAVATRLAAAGEPLATQLEGKDWIARCDFTAR